MNFTKQLIQSYNAFPERHAFNINNHHYTYSELFDIAGKIAVEIEERFTEEKNIGIVVTNHVETYATIVASLLLGKTYVPIHPDYPQDRAQNIFEQAGIKALFAVGEVIYDAVTIVDASRLLPAATPFNFAAQKYTPSANAYILFTSGSTGVPKGVPISFYNVDSFVEAFFKLGYKISEEDRFLQMFDLTFDLSVMSYLVPLCIGACAYTIPSEGMKFTNVYQVLEEHNITFALMVPSILAGLRPYFDEIDLPAMRYSLFCGEALYADVTSGWMKCIPNAIIENVYGPTEATIFCLTYPVDRSVTVAAYNGIVAIGKPMYGMDAVVIDSEYKVVESGEKGELCLCGNQLTQGYLDAERNINVFFELEGKRYYRTGDIAYKTAGGDFMYGGRLDHQVKIQGYRVELSEIEHHLRVITADTNLVALAVNNANNQAEIHVVFETTTIDQAHVFTLLQEKIPPYMLPTQMHCLRVFPLNTNGKTDRKELTKIIKNLG